MSTKLSAAPVETCDLCLASIADEHQHVFDPAKRELQCVCDGCAILFSGQGRYKRVPRRIRVLDDFQLTEIQWNSLAIPIGVAFFVRRAKDDRIVAVYPSPGGPIESQLDLESWQEIASENPVLSGIERDVEGLLVYRVGAARNYFLIPIDEFYKLVGLIRLHWRGFSGGALLWEEVGKFLERLKHSGSLSSHARS
jgi:hypothetical protein